MGTYNVQHFMGGPKIRAFQDALGPGATFEPNAILGSILSYSLEPIREHLKKCTHHYSVLLDAWYRGPDSVDGPEMFGPIYSQIARDVLFHL